MGGIPASQTMARLMLLCVGRVRLFRWWWELLLHGGMFWSLKTLNPRDSHVLVLVLTPPGAATEFPVPVWTVSLCASDISDVQGALSIPAACQCSQASVVQVPAPYRK